MQRVELGCGRSLQAACCCPAPHGCPSSAAPLVPPRHPPAGTATNAANYQPWGSGTSHPAGPGCPCGPPPSKWVWWGGVGLLALGVKQLSHLGGTRKAYDCTPRAAWEAHGCRSQRAGAAASHQVQHVLVVNKLDVAPLDGLALVLSLCMAGGGWRGSSRTVWQDRAAITGLRPEMMRGRFMAPGEQPRGQHHDFSGRSLHGGLTGTPQALLPAPFPFAVRSLLHQQYQHPTCSILKTCWLKCCCSFSLARLMQNCSKSFSLNCSKPAACGHEAEARQRWVDRAQQATLGLRRRRLFKRAEPWSAPEHNAGRCALHTPDCANCAAAHPATPH